MMYGYRIDEYVVKLKEYSGRILYMFEGDGMEMLGYMNILFNRNLLIVLIRGI